MFNLIAGISALVFIAAITGAAWAAIGTFEVNSWSDWLILAAYAWVIQKTFYKQG